MTRRLNHRLPGVERFRRYELLEEIGRGGQGVVYRHDKKSEPDCALKVIGLAHWATEAHVKRFRLERKPPPA